MRRLTTTLLAAGAAAAFAAAPAHAAKYVFGSDLSAPATIAHGDPNDFVMWPSAVPAGTIEAPYTGEVIKVELKGGTVQTAAQHARGEAFDPDFDIFHFLVMSKRDGHWVTTWNSKDLEARRIGDNATADTVETYKATADNFLCVNKGDRIGVGSVGGYVPGIFERGLQYQIFGSTPGAESWGYEHGGNGVIDREAPGSTPTKMKPTFTYGGEELLMRVTVGTGANARNSCDNGGTANRGTYGDALLDAQDPAPGSVGSKGKDGKTVKPPMATPLNKRRVLGKNRTVPVSLTCRRDGAPCAGTVELRVHKQRIGLAKYEGLAPGATAEFPVKLTKRGVYYVNADSDRKMLTTVLATARGGRSDGGKMYILPRKGKPAKSKKR